MFQKLHHVAYRCRDAQETTDFYTKVLGLKYAAGEMSPEGSKPYGEEVDLIHIFFECGDGSYIAFFDLPSSPPAESDRNTPNWVNHIAFEVPDMDALLEGKRRLEAAGVDVLGPKDHSFCQSIYFFDPNGIRLEMTVRTEAPGELHRMASVAGDQLAAWNARKQRKYGSQAVTREAV
jgi:glyoxylase I family protein